MLMTENNCPNIDDKEIDDIRKRAMEFAHIGIYRYTLEGDIVFLDKGILKILELDHLYPDPEKLVGTKLKDLFVYIKKEASLRNDVLKYQQVKDYEYPFQLLNGKIKWVLHDAYLVENDDEQPCIQVIARDITKLKEAELKLEEANKALQKYKEELEITIADRTRDLKNSNEALLVEVKERKRVEEELRDSQYRYRKIFDSALDGIIIIDSETKKLTAVNPAFCNLLDYTEEELLKLSLQDLHPQSQYEEILQKFNNVSAKEESIYENVACLRKDGSSVDVTITSIEIELKGRKQKLGFITDETEKKKLEQQLIQSEKMSAVGYLAAGIAHEFNNILMLNQVNFDLLKLLLREKLLPDDNMKQCFENVSSSLKRGANVVLNLMEFARPKEPQIKVVTIESIIDEVLKIHDYLMTQNQIEVTRLYKANILLEIDPDLLFQVFSNLLINAAHAISVKGKGKISIETGKTSDSVVILIKDDGQGMSSETVTSAFTPFFSTKRPDESSQAEQRGSGLGLSITHQIIQKHRGKITIQSDLHIGTEIRVILPIPEGPPQPEHKVENVLDFKKVRNQNVHILLVDDEEEIVEQIKKMLNLNGYHNISICASGKDAIQQYKNNPADVLILDLLIPDMKGVEVLMEIRKASPAVPVIFMSGQVNLHVEELQKTNALGYLQKPFHIEQLITMLEKI